MTNNARYVVRRRDSGKLCVPCIGTDTGSWTARRFVNRLAKGKPRDIANEVARSMRACGIEVDVEIFNG